MKKIFGFLIGGLQHKINALVIIVILVTCLSGILLSVRKTMYLSNVVQTSRTEQQKAIETISTETMHQTINSAMTKTNQLQAYITDDMFAEVKSEIMTLQSLAQSYFEQKDKLEPAVFELPDPQTEGQYTAQVLYEEGVDYTQSEYLGIGAHMSNTMIAMCEHSGYIDNCYIGFEDGTHLGVDEHAANKYDASGNLMPFPVRERFWYRNAVEAGDVYFSSVEKDTFTGLTCVTCAAPVYADNKLIGVVGIDLFLKSMAEYVNNSINESGFIFIVDNEGKIVFAPENNGLFTVELSENAESLQNSENQELAGFVTDALSETTGLRKITIDGKEYYVVGSPVPTTGWAVITVVDKAVTELSTNHMLDEFDRISEEAVQQYHSGTSKLKTLTIVVYALIFLISIAITKRIANKIVKPIESMTGEIAEGIKTGKQFEMKDTYRTGDEIEVLAESFDDLSKKAADYITHIKKITKEKERIGTELSLATKIQASMLPHIFPPYPDRTEFDIYATMEPAREVGGDFYDFFLIDEDHLCLVMADVSGKGIPAALFMMISKTILQSCAMLGKKPAEILTLTNEALCANNQVEMFVTVWIGILEISTGKLTASNAGHEYPVLKRPDGQFEILKDKHSLAVGVLEGTRYSEYEILLEPGGKLFLYTDGVPEATDAAEEMFGNPRMLEALNKESDAEPKTLLNNVREAVSEFVKEAEQFDDLTMMCIEYKGKGPKTEEKD